MKNITKNIMALAMIVGFANISASTPFYSNSFESQPDGLWNKDDNTAQITDESNTIYCTGVTQDDKSKDSEYKKIGVTSKIKKNTTNLYGIISKIDIAAGNNAKIGTPSSFESDSSYIDSNGKQHYVFVPIKK